MAVRRRDGHTVRIAIPANRKILIEIDAVGIGLECLQVILNRCRRSPELCIRFPAILDNTFCGSGPHRIYSQLGNRHPVRVGHRNNMQAEICKKIRIGSVAVGIPGRIVLKIVLDLLHSQKAVYILSGMDRILDHDMIRRRRIPQSDRINLPQILRDPERLVCENARITLIKEIQVLDHLFVCIYRCRCTYNIRILTRHLTQILLHIMCADVIDIFGL